MVQSVESIDQIRFFKTLIIIEYTSRRDRWVKPTTFALITSPFTCVS